MNELLNIVPLPVLLLIGILILASVIWMGISYLKDKTLDEIRGDVYQLVLAAEHKYKESASGKQKMKWVVSQARKLLPEWVQTIVSDEIFEDIIQVWFDEVKDLLDDGKVNGSNKG